MTDAVQVARVRLHLRDHADHEAMSVDGYTMEFVTLGDLRTLLAAVDTLTRERDEAVELLDLAQQEAPRVLADALAPIEAQRDRYRAALEDIAERPSYPVDNRDAFETALSRANRALTEDT